MSESPSSVVPLKSVIGTSKLPVQEAVEWIERILVPLQELHGRTPGVAHGDLRPETILVGADGAIAFTGGFPGASRHTDVYALGVMLVAMLSGRDATEIRGEVAHFGWRPMVQVSGRWEPLLTAMLADEPADRLQDAFDVRDAIAAGRRATATPAPAPARPLEKDELPPWVGVAIGVGMILGLVGFVLLAWLFGAAG